MTLSNEYQLANKMYLMKAKRLANLCILLILNIALLSQQEFLIDTDNMFYFQNGQKDYMKEFDNAFLVWDPTGWELPIYGSEKICNMWDGVPA